MDLLNKYFKEGVAIAGTGLTWLFGDWDTALEILVLFMVLDYCTGVLKSYVNHQLSSDSGLKGIARKCVILIVLIIAVALDRLLETGHWVFRTLICYFYIANEGISVLENCAALGLPIPPRLSEALIQLKDGEKKDPNK